MSAERYVEGSKHTDDHDQWDAGGYCNNLVEHEGDGEVCGYRQPRPRTSGVQKGGATTDAQLIAALNAFELERRRQVGTDRWFNESMSLDDWGPEGVAQMRAALAAAGVAPPECRDCGGFGRVGDGPDALGAACPECGGAGVAPPAPSADRETLAEAARHTEGEPQRCDCGRPGCDGQTYCTWCSNEWPCLVDRLSALAAPAPVDEAKLAEVIERAIDKLRHETRLYPDIYAPDVAKAVVEHLEGDR